MLTDRSTRISRHLAAPALLVASLLLTPAVAQAVPTISSTFETGTTEGWTAQNAVTLQAQATGGNPGGCLFVDNDDAVPWCRLQAPAGFRGDIRSYYGGTLSFDGRMAAGSSGSQSAAQHDYGRIFLIDHQGYWIAADAAPGLPTTNQWQTFSLTLTPATFGVTQATLDWYLGNLTQLGIGMEALNGPEAHFIDNIRLAPGPTPAAAQPAGAGCASSGGSNTLVAWALPWSGTTSETRAYGVPTPCLAIGVYGFAPLPSLPLNTLLPQGVAGCSLHVSPDVLTTFWVTSLMATFQLPIASDPALVGASYWHQVVPFAVNGGGAITTITATNALRMTIGLR